MSLVITGNQLVFILFLLISLNGFFVFKKIPLLAIPSAGISIIFMLAFTIDYSGFIIVLLLMLVVFVIASLVINISSLKH